jgi:ubiquinone/menaquinone biosynthesis C-methylase UbiE
MNAVSKSMKEHYQRAFTDYGACSKGVDWGKPSEVETRYEKMISVIKPQFTTDVSLLDVGCGYGGLLDFIKRSGKTINYSGIDVAENMIAYAQKKYPENNFICGDVIQQNFKHKFDFVVCNGILTQKLSNSLKEMDEFAKVLIQTMFELCNLGIAFNVMTNKVNFMADNLYYKSPVEILSHCLDNLSNYITLDHSYGLYEFTVYVYKESQ